MNITRNIFKVRPLYTCDYVVHYSRWTHRRPKRVLTEEETVDVGPKSDIRNNQLKKATKWKLVTRDPEVGSSTLLVDQQRKHRLTKPLTVKEGLKKQTSTDLLDTVIDANGNFIFTKMNNNDPRVGKILNEVKSRKDLGKKSIMLIEGKRLIKEALQANCILKYIIFSRKDEVEYLAPYLPKYGAKLYKMPYREMQLWSDLNTNPGIMAIFKIPEELKQSSPDSLPLTVVLENVREPGNMGAILRVCAGAGCERVLVMKGCVYLWDTKVLRGGAGAHFKMDIHQVDSWSQLREQYLDRRSVIFLADNRIILSSDQPYDEQRQPENESGSEGEQEAVTNLEDVVSRIPVVPYYGVNFKGLKRPAVLVVGGETHGISVEAYCHALNTSGTRLNVPLNCDMESLNVAAAVGVLTFEFKRQFLCNT